MSSEVLVLTAGMEPHRVIHWQKAIMMIFRDAVEVLEEYDEVLYESPSLQIRMPAVIRLTHAFRIIRKSIKFSRINVFTRDKFVCQYCGAKKSTKELNYDHVIPRHLGGKTTWENIVSSCYPCNSQKRNRTPDQAGMKLLNQPAKPQSLPLHSALQLGRNVPEPWSQYLHWHSSYWNCT